MIAPNITIHFTSYEDLQETNRTVLIDSIAKSFAFAKGDLRAMQELNQLAKELRYATEVAMDELLHGPVPRKDILEPAVLRETIA